MAAIAKKTRRYPSDLTDEEWERTAPLMPVPQRTGRLREVEFREVINVIRYLVRSGCGWRMLSVHFGHWRIMYDWFRELARRFLFQTIHDVELMLDRERAGREASPSAGVVDNLRNLSIAYGNGTFGSSASRSRPSRPKRGATTRARRWSGANTTSPSIPTAVC